MPWNRWYSFKSYLRSALWIVPLFALIAAMVVKRASEEFGNWGAGAGLWIRGQAFLMLNPEEAQGLLDRIFNLNLSFLVFTFGSLLVAIQVAGGQYTFPDGMFFGGQKATWSNQTFRAIVKKHGAGAKRVGLIDFHSGLGPTGYGEPICIVAPNMPGFERARGHPSRTAPADRGFPSSAGFQAAAWRSPGNCG